MAVRILLLQPSQLQTHRPPALLAETAVVVTVVAVATVVADVVAKTGSNSNLPIPIRGAHTDAPDFLIYSSFSDGSNVIGRWTVFSNFRRPSEA